MNNSLTKKNGKWHLTVTDSDGKVVMTKTGKGGTLEDQRNLLKEAAKNA